MDEGVSCVRGCPGALVPIADETGVALLFCATCRRTFCPGDQVARWLGGELGPSFGLLDLPVAVHGARCPRGCGTMLALPADLGEALRCERCRGLLVAPGTLPALRARMPRSVRPRARPTSRPPPEDEGELVGARLHFADPRLDLVALPVAFVLAALVLATTLGRLLFVPVQIQFHELGHALFGWLSSRAALPLPFGFTFWREQRSTFTGACMLFLLGVLAFHGLRERRRFAVVLAGFFFACFVLLSLALSAERTLELMLWGGIAGEFVLPALVLVAFSYRMPDRLRWDFFRFVVVVPAAGTWLSAVTLWLGIARGTRPMPLGSILGTPGDGSGDLDRLMADYGLSAAALTRSYLAVALCTGVMLGVHLALLALRARALKR